MSVLIKDMAMPTSCRTCPLKMNCDECEGLKCVCVLLHHQIGYFDDLLTDKRRDDCPLGPSSDVVEVRHGKWHMFLKGSSSYNGVQVLSDAFQCTVCKESFWNKSNYCPNCGAKMDGGQDDV